MKITNLSEEITPKKIIWKAGDIFIYEGAVRAIVKKGGYFFAVSLLNFTAVSDGYGDASDLMYRTYSGVNKKLSIKEIIIEETR